MKLHLPHGLRKALLACLAALALPTSLPTTLGTASGWVAVSLLAPQQVAAADVTFTGARTNKNGDPYNAALNDSNTENDTWTFNVPTTQKFYFGTGQNTTTTHNANFKFEQTLTISDGFSGADQIFNGAFTGQQGANLDFAWASHTSTWQFNGDLSGFAGDILATTGTLNVVFGEGEGAKSNTGAIKQDGGTLNLTLNGQTMNNSEISVNNLTVNGATTLAGGSVTVAGALTLNSNASLNLSNVAGTYQFAGINDAADATGVSITGTKDVTLRLTGGGTYSTSAAISGYNVILEKSGTGTQKFTGTSAAIDFDKLLLTGGTLEFGCNLNVSGSSSSDRTLAWTQVSGGASLVVNGDFLTPNPVSVTGGSSMTVTGNVTLNTWSMLTVNGGATVTISGTLGGNKSGAGELRVGSHDDTGGTGTKGVLTLGTSGNNGVSHKSDAVKVYGEGSVLTVYGDLTAEGFEATDKNGGGTTTDIALEVKYGANATVTGNLTLGASDDNLEIGGTEDGNTGTLTVNGSLAGASVSVQGEGSTLTVDGTVTLTTDSTLGAGSVMNVTGLGKVTGIEHLTGDGMLNVVLSADETPTAATQLNVNTTITTGEGVGAASVNLGARKGLTLAGGKTLTLGSGVTLKLNENNTLSLGADAKITLEERAVLNVGDTIGRVKDNSTGWYNITGEGEVYQETSGDVAAAGIKFDANYHIKSTKQGGTGFTDAVKSVSVRDLILEGSFNINSVDRDTQEVTTLNLRGLVGESGTQVNTNGTWTFNIGAGDSEKTFAGTFTSTEAARGATITKQGEGTQVFGTLGNFASLTVEAGKMKLNALNLTASYDSTITLASGATLDMSEATAFGITGTGLTINVGTADAAVDGVFTSGKLLLNTGLIESLTELATNDKLTLKFTGLTSASLADSNAWTCDLFAGMTFAEGTTDALAAFLEDALDFSALGAKGEKGKDIVVGTDGHVTILFAGDDLYMDAAGGEITWKDKGDVVWHNGTPDGTKVKFKNRDNVTFDDAKGTTVTMEGELIAGNFTVTRGTWTFKNSAESEPTLTIQGEVSVAEGSVVSWESLAAVTILGDSFIDGTWTGESMVVTLGDITALDTSDITMEVGGNSDTSSMDVASIVTAEGDHAPTTHLVVTGQGHLEVGEVNVTDATVGGTQTVAGIATDAAGSQLVVGTLTLTGSGTSADAPEDVLRVGEGGTVTVSSKLTSTGANARITVDGGTLIVGTPPGNDTVVADLVLQMTATGSIDVQNGGSLQVYGQVGAGSNGVIGSLTVSGDETTVGVQGTLYTTTATVSGGSFTVGGLLYAGGNGEDHVAIGTQVDGGGHLTAASYTSTRNTVVTGEGSTMEVTGNAELRNWADLTINDGATVTVNGTLKGNKQGENGGAYAGVIYVGGYDSTQGASKDTLTLGAAQSTTTHSVHGVKVYGTGSSLTVNGSLGTYGYDRVTDATISGLEVMYGATATISGNLTCGDGNDVRSNLVLGGKDVDNTGTLTVGGTLTAGDVTIAGAGSSLTVGGELTESSIKGKVTLDDGKLTGKTAAGVTLDVVMAAGMNGGTLNGVEGGLTAALSGTGTLTAQGTLTLSGAIAGQLQMDVDHGVQVTITDALSVGGLNGTSGTVNGGDLTITGGGGSFGGPLTVGNLTMEGSGEQTFTGSTIVNGSVSVTQGGLILGGEETHLGKGATVSDGGTLTLRSEKTTLGTDAWLKAVGTNSSIVLDFGSESWNKEESGNINVELAGGTLDMSNLAGEKNTQEVHLNHLSGTGGSLKWKESLESGNKQTVHVGELSLASGKLDLGTLGNGQELHLEQLKNVGGDITGTASGGKVYLGYVTQAAGTSGSIQVEGGVHVHSHGGTSDGFWKQGEGSFAVKSQLIVDDGSLYMNYDGTLTWGTDGIDGSETALKDDQINVASGVTLEYTDQTKLLLLGVGLFGDFTEDNNSSLHLDLTKTDLSRLSGGFDLGIVSETEDSDLLDQLTGVIELDDIEFEGHTGGTEGIFSLEWKQAKDGTYHLHLIIEGEVTISESEWDMAWGDGLIGAPSNKDMEDHRWGGDGDPFSATTGTTGGFTAHALELGKTGSSYIDRKHTLIRLTQGAAKTDEKTAATVIGGIIVDDADDPEKSYFDSYIEYNVDYEIGDKDHVHLLVGGSSCVYAGGGEGAYASFEGTSHIQVESGTVDYIVGGNHVNNSTFTFKGDSYITVFGGQVLGSVVGGSTLTKGTSDDSLYAFNGNTHIFIYTPMQGTQDTPAISDGTEGTDGKGHGAAFTAVVGGNAWVDFATAQGKDMRPQFFGHTQITIDLVNPAYEGNTENPYQFGDGRDAGDFEKAIVGGNYTAAVTASEEGGKRTTVFRGDAQIEIYAGEGHTFTAGINGASRWDSGGAGTTEFIGDTHVNIHGGQYTEAVAGGMWFNATGGTGGALAKHEGTFTGDTEVQIEDGRLWRVVGGNVSLEGGTGSEETFTGVSNVTINGGTFSAREQDTLEATAIPAVVGGSFYRNTTGTATHVGAGEGSGESALTNVTINGGTFEYVHIVGGDCVNMSGVEKGQITLEGSTHLVIGEKGSTTEPEIVGLLSGGSHLSDSGAGGSITVGKGEWKNQKGKYATEVEIHGGTITAEGANGNPHTHGNVVVVAGNVLLDSSRKETGGGRHRSEIWGGTHLVMDGGTVNGFVVGGSYSSDSLGGTNELVIAGESTMEFTGGTVNGNIVGGHFSENTSAPDNLTLGNVNITVDGGTVNGYIFGGSYRKATQALDESPTQGDITITLTSGTIKGGVYAAGNHYNTAGGTGLHVRTDSTRVEIGSGMRFEVGEQSGAENQYIVVSGGYLRSGDAATRVKDYSTVGYTEGTAGAAGTWADECAVLSFTEDPSKYTNLTSAKMRFQDFDAMEVTSGKLELNESQLLVMHKVAAEGVTGNDSFAKMGAGSLVLGKGLGSFLGQSDKVTDFTGKIILDGGTLTLGGGKAQSLAGGLRVNMAGRTPGNKNDAYLQVFDDGTTFTIDGLTADNKMEITLDKSETGETLKTGVYYIADGLVGLDSDTLKEYVGKHYIELQTSALAGDTYECHLELRGEHNEQLVLRVQNNDPTKWVWEGDKGGVWNPKDNKNWTHKGEETDEAYRSDMFLFNSGADVCGDVKVASGIDISKGTIAVESGQYRFVQQPTEGGGDYTGLKVGTLQVGVKNEEGMELELADVELALPTDKVGIVELYDNGRFTIGNEHAIQEDTKDMQGTQLKFCGKGEGILKYAENGNGYLVYKGDLSKQVSPDSEVETGLHIQVGNGAMDDVEEVVRDDTEGVTWSGGNGVKLAVNHGIIKTGRKMFRLNWTPGTEQFAGTLEAVEGELVLEAEGNATIATGKEGTKLLAEEGATLKLQVKDGATLTVSRAASGAGKIRIGSAAEKGGQTYILGMPVGEKNFTGTVALEGNGTNSTARVQATGALGNAQSTLALAGRAIVATASEAAAVTVKEIVVEEGTVNLIGGYGTEADAETSYTLTAGSVSGTGVLANAQGGFHATLSAGNLSAFEGTLVAGKQGVGSEGQSTWTLSSTLASSEAEVVMSLAGTGKVIVKYTPGEGDAAAGEPGKVLLTGSIGDATLGNSVSVEHASAGTILVLAGQNKTTTGDLIFNGNEIWLGDESHEGSWAGTKLAQGDKAQGGTFRLRNGTLKNAMTDLGGVTLAVDTAESTGERERTLVDVGGTAGSQFDEIVINDSGHLRGVGGDITVGSGEGQTRVELYFGAGSCGEAASGNAADYLIESTGNLVVSEVQSLFQDGPEDDLKDEAVFAMDFSNEGLFELLKKHREEGRKSYLHVLSGGDIIFDPETVEEQLNELLRTGTYSKLLYGLSFTLGVEGGDLILRGSSSEVYLVLSDESDPQGNKHTVNTAEDAGVLAGKKATLLDKGTTLTVELGEGKAGDSVTVHNLVGLSGSALEASGEGTVFLDNTEVVPDPLDTDPWVGDKVDDAGHLGQLKGQDTYFDGMLRSADVQTRFVKTGAGTLTVGDGTESGGVDIAGELRLENGDFVVHGGENGVLGTLTFAYGEGAVHEKDFVVRGGKVTVGALNETGGGKVTLEQRGTFAFVGDNTATPLENLQFTGNGTLEVGGDGDGGKLALGGTSSIAGLDVQVDKDSTLSLRDGAALDDVGTVTLSENATLDLSGSAHETQHTVGTLTDNSKGTGILKGGANTDLTVTKGGSFGGTLSGSGKLTIAKDATFSMAGVKTDASASTNAWGITVRKDGSLTLDTSKQREATGPTFGDVVFGDGSDITLRFDYNTDNGSTARTHSLTIEKGAHLTLESVSAGSYPGSDLRVRIAYSEVEGKVEDVEVELKGKSFLYFEKDGDVFYDDGAYYVGVKEVKENRFEQALPGMDKNAQAGAELFWSAFAPNKNEALGNVLADKNSDLSKMRDALTGMLDNKDKAGLERTLAAGAGASISVLGPALAEDMHRQLISMRNRSTTLTEDLPTDGYDAFPYWHAWITGEGGYHKLDADGFAPGYTLNNWGGSVGADANITQRTSVGLALTAMYGDLKTDATDSASGNIDTVYLSGYLRHAIGAWSHTVALSVGMADVKLDRTVSYGSGSYHTNGDTDGLAFGLLYEVGYTKFVNKNRTFALQPIANVELRHAMIDGYTETGSDAGLRVDDIKQTILTFGAGVRVQGLVGGRAFNDSATLEARALVKADVGDRSGTSKHAIIHDTTQAEVESAEVGAVGVEAGVGLSVPLGRNLGSIIIDGSVEFRSGWTSANASAGYRISF